MEGGNYDLYGPVGGSFTAKIDEEFAVGSPIRRVFLWNVLPQRRYLRFAATSVATSATPQRGGDLCLDVRLA